MIIFGLVGVVGLVSLVCWILVLIKIFQGGNIGLGILGIICPIFTFVYGWVKVDQYQIKNIMIIWSVAIVISIGLNFAMPHSTVVYTSH
jgi:hypothetical protein